MFITKKHISRRTVLKGAGVNLALPFLSAMVLIDMPHFLPKSCRLGISTKPASLFGEMMPWRQTF